MRDFIFHVPPRGLGGPGGPVRGSGEGPDEGMGSGLRNPQSLFEDRFELVRPRFPAATVVVPIFPHEARSARGIGYDRIYRISGEAAHPFDAIALIDPDFRHSHSFEASPVLYSLAGGL